MGALQCCCRCCSSLPECLLRGAVWGWDERRWVHWVRGGVALGGCCHQLGWHGSQLFGGQGQIVHDVEGQLVVPVARASGDGDCCSGVYFLYSLCVVCEARDVQRWKLRACLALAAGCPNHCGVGCGGGLAAAVAGTGTAAAAAPALLLLDVAPHHTPIPLPAAAAAALCCCCRSAAPAAPFPAAPCLRLQKHPQQLSSHCRPLPSHHRPPPLPLLALPAPVPHPAHHHLPSPPHSLHARSRCGSAPPLSPPHRLAHSQTRAPGSSQKFVHPGRDA
mmetsp:Transcript_3859/g.10471  ORF Transcript_3859/g.10471 Transcript_3859/m.10471 type:complete len:276 (+) Transcript_3859:1353-2180(+)|eukprot:822494-Pelagomonas_calceolata.AAC.3